MFSINSVVLNEELKAWMLHAWMRAETKKEKLKGKFDRRAQNPILGKVAVDIDLNSAR